MVVPRKSVQVRLPEPAYEVLERWCKFTDRSQTKLIAVYLGQWEKRYLASFNEEQRAKYFAGEMRLEDALSFAEPPEPAEAT
jgi:hypothetical protein